MSSYYASCYWCLSEARCIFATAGRSRASGSSWETELKVKAMVFEALLCVWHCARLDAVNSSPSGCHPPGPEQPEPDGYLVQGNHHEPLSRYPQRAGCCTSLLTHLQSLFGFCCCLFFVFKAFLVLTVLLSQLSQAATQFFFLSKCLVRDRHTRTPH